MPCPVGALQKRSYPPHYPKNRTARTGASIVGFLSQVSHKTKTRSRGAHPKPGQQRDEAAASLGGEQPHPSRTARKLTLPRVSSATRGPIPRSPPKTQAERDRAAASLGGEQPHPSRTARKLILPRNSSATGGPIPRSPPKTRAAAGSGRSKHWRRSSKYPRAPREISSSPEPPQRPKVRSRGATANAHYHSPPGRLGECRGKCIP